MYKDVAAADLMACYRLLEAASSAAYYQNDSDWDIQLRRDDRVEVHGMKKSFEVDTTLLDMVSTYFLIKKFKFYFVPVCARRLVQIKFKYILLVQIKI